MVVVLSSNRQFNVGDYVKVNLPDNSWPLTVIGQITQVGATSGKLKIATIFDSERGSRVRINSRGPNVGDIISIDLGNIFSVAPPEYKNL